MVSGVDYEEGLRFLKDDELPSLSRKLVLCVLLRLFSYGRDGHEHLIVEFYIPIIRIPYYRWDDSSPI